MRNPNETMQQYRGRQKREMNDANDALCLKEGEPIWYGRGKTRFHPRMIHRQRPSRISRLEGEDLSSFLTEESAKRELDERDARVQRERKAFLALPHVRDAESIRWIIESRLMDVIALLTLAEWAEFGRKLEA